MDLPETYLATAGTGTSRVRVAASFRSLEAVRKGVRLVPPRSATHRDEAHRPVQYSGPRGKFGSKSDQNLSPNTRGSEQPKTATKTAPRGRAKVAQNHATPVKCLALPTGPLFGCVAGAADPPQPPGGAGAPPHKETTAGATQTKNWPPGDENTYQPHPPCPSHS